MLPSILTSIPPLLGLNLIFHSVQQGGGMERHVLDMITYASNLGIKVRVVTRRLHWPGAHPKNVEFVILRDQTPFSRVNTFVFEKRAITKCQPDWPIIGISRCPGVTMAVVGGTHRGHLRDRKKSRIGYFDRATIIRENAMYHSAKTIVTHSDKVAQEIIELYGVPHTKVTTLYPPIDCKTFSLEARQNRGPVRQSLGITEQQFLLLFPSNNHTLKGADLILEALENFDPRIRLAVAGKAPLRSPKVINLGFRDDMPALYAAADAVILASHYEAFGMVGPEAILCGTPAIFATTIGAVEVLSHTACIQFERNVQSLRTAIKIALQRFEAGTLELDSPPSHIHYPFTVEQHFDAVFALLAKKS
jgi:glycosyltransferase involved in cell wall biosynthesis